ncbi:MAG: putative cytochrome, partial [Acidimicrobiia bacterium]|nr:putative cytochrome [Acidimicrobiia bacterium]
MSTTEHANEHRNVIDFDHHAPSLRDHNTEVLHGLIYSEPRCPMGWSEHYDGFWAIWGYDALYDAVQNATLFSSAHTQEHPKGVPPNPNPSPLIPIDIDGPIQQEFRKLSLGWFNPGTAKAMEPRINEICTELIDAFIERGECDLSEE